MKIRQRKAKFHGTVLGVIQKCRRRFQERRFVRFTSRFARHVSPIPFPSFWGAHALASSVPPGFRMEHQ